MNTHSPPKPLEIPTLDKLIADPSKAAQLAPDTAQALLIELVSLQPILIQRALMGAPNGQAEPVAPDRWLSVEQVIAQYSVTERWLYRHKRQLPCSQPSRKVLLFNETKLRQWFSAHKAS
jgi:hypothetical protein